MAPKQQQAAAKGAAAAQHAKPAAAAATALPIDVKPVAVIVADSFNEDMKPLTAVRPRALMQVANVALIEYALELLVVNGFKEVKIVAYFGADLIHDHLEKTVTYTGKTWLNSNEISVDVIKGSTGTQSLAAALIDVLHKHVLPEYFMLLPVDVLTTARNLGAIFATHVRRHRANPTMVLTCATLEAATPMLDAHTVAVKRAMSRTEAPTSPQTAVSMASSGHHDFPPPYAVLQRPDAQSEALGRVLRTTTNDLHVTIAYEPQRNSIITGYQSWWHNERELQQQLSQAADGEKSKVTNAAVAFQLTKKSDTIVRTDLILPGIFVVSQGFVTEVLQQEAMISDTNDMLRYFVDNPGYCMVLASVDFLSEDARGNPWTLDDAAAASGVGATVRPLQPSSSSTGSRSASTKSPVPPEPPSPVVSVHGFASSRPQGSTAYTAELPPFLRVFQRGSRIPTQSCVAIPIRNIASYIDANIAVLERRLFPFTRESNFADKNPVYAVWRHMPNVYIHVAQPERLSAHMALGPNVAIGADCHIDRSACVAGCVIGNRVTIGPNAVVLHSVLHDDIVIGANVNVHQSVIGSEVKINAPFFHAEGVVIGDGVVITMRTVDGLQVPPKVAADTRIHVPLAGATPKDPELVGDHGRGVAYTRGAKTSAFPTELVTLFDRDQPRRRENDDEDADDAFTPQEVLYEVVLRDMERAVQAASSIEPLLMAWKHAMLSHALDTEDLLESITRAVICHVAPKAADAENKKAAQRAVSAVFSRFLRPVYRVLILKTKADRRRHMIGILRGFAAAMQSPDAESVQDRSHLILSTLLGGADQDLYESEGWCIVDFDSIVEFDDAVADGAEEVCGHHDPAIVAIGWEYCRDYVDELRAEDEDA